MKIKHLLLLTVLIGSGPMLAADAASAQSNASTVVKESPAKKAAPKKKVKRKAKTTKQNTAEANEPGKVSPQLAEVDPAAIAAATDLYKKELAEKIVKANPAKVFEQQPQALLRSVVVLKFFVDADGKLIKSAIRRSNHDPVTEETALESLRQAAPLPKPPPILVRHGPVELYETWLFNKDGRFQIHSSALQQLTR